MLTLADIREAVRLVWDAKPKAQTYYHHPLCIDKGPWGHVDAGIRCPIERRDD